jgi:hypothetical protein
VDVLRRPGGEPNIPASAGFSGLSVWSRLTVPQIMIKVATANAIFSNRYPYHKGVSTSSFVPASRIPHQESR